MLLARQRLNRCRKNAAGEATVDARTERKLSRRQRRAVSGLEKFIWLSIQSLDKSTNGRVAGASAFSPYANNSRAFSPYANNSHVFSAIANNSRAFRSVANNSHAFRSVANNSRAFSSVARNSFAFRSVGSRPISRCSVRHRLLQMFRM